MSGKGKFRIEPFKHRVELDAQVSPRDHRASAPQFFHESHAPETNFHPDHSLTLRAALNPRFAPPQYAEKTWKVLKDAIHEIHHRNASGLSFEELYRNAYNMVLHRHGDALYKGLVSLVTEHLRGVAGEVNAERGEGILGELIKRWDHHTHSMQMVRDILMYMDRIYVQPNGLKPVHDLGLQLWRDQVMRGPGIKSRVRDAVLGAVNRERCGEKVDTHQLRAVTAMLMDLGEDCYAKDFEEPFLAATTEFYRAEAQTFLADSDCAQYLRKVESRLAEEQARVLEYMNARTVKTAVARCEEELLTGPMRQTLSMPGSGLSSMLVGDRVGDLRLVYKVFRRVPNGLKFVKEMVFEHVSAEGKSLVTDPETGKEPGRYVEGLLRMKDKYGGIVDAAFDGDRQFIKALHLSFENFVNLNNRSAEYLSLYVDDQLRRSLKGAEEEEVEATLDRAIVLFRFLREKDVFQKYYQEHLSKRLLGGRTTSDDAERSLVVKLKTECGYQFTTKFEGMFNDIRTSRDSMSAFRTHLEERAASGDLAMAAEPSSSALTADADGVKVKTAGGVSSYLGGVDLSVQVLTTGSWPVKGQNVSMCTLPPGMQAACHAYRDFYLGSHNGRRLAFLTQMGTADVRATFGDGVRRELSVSTYMACVLVLFNDTESLSYRDIEAATQIPGDDLRRSLQSLACVRGKNVLRKEPMSKDVNDDDVFSVNDKFTSKMMKVKISTVSAQRETEPEKKETRARIEEDRKPQIEAAIVRIMKARRQLDHNGVVQEVTKQLSSRFIPSPADIKKHLESLIEKEFIERDRHDRKLYIYLA